jgi:hypothetical protein
MTGETVTDQTAERVSVSRRIAAPAAKIFELISHPQGHVDIDGSGMLLAAPDARALTAVGDVFEISMDREPLGDVPMGKYQVENVVTQFEAGSLLEWNVAVKGRPAGGHVYGYQLIPISAIETDVVNYCDWSGMRPEWKAKVSWPVVPAHMLETSMDTLQRLVEN